MMSSAYCSEIPYNIYSNILYNTLLNYLLLQTMSFLYQRSGRFKLGICPPPSRKLNVQIFKLSIQVFFDTEIDGTGNPKTNIWNILQLSINYVSDLLHL